MLSIKPYSCSLIFKARSSKSRWASRKSAGDVQCISKFLVSFGICSTDSQNQYRTWFSTRGTSIPFVLQPLQGMNFKTNYMFLLICITYNIALQMTWTPTTRNGHLSLDISQSTIGQAQVDQAGGHLRRWISMKSVDPICSNHVYTYMYIRIINIIYIWNYEYEIFSYVYILNIIYLMQSYVISMGLMAVQSG